MNVAGGEFKAVDPYLRKKKKISNKQPNFTLRRVRNRTNKTQS